MHRRRMMREIMMMGGSPPWYMMGGAPPLAAYQAINVVSYAASKVNLVNPGTYNLVDNHASSVPVLWSSYDGWNAFGGNSMFLDTGIANPDDGWTIVCRFSECGTSCAIFGTSDAEYLTIYPNASSVSKVRVYHGNTATDTAPVMASGVLSIAGRKSYRNGVFDSDLDNLTAPIADSIKLLTYDEGRVAGIAQTTKMQAFVVYDRTLTAPENLSLARAMLAIPLGNPAYIYDGMILSSSIGR